MHCSECLRIFRIVSLLDVLGHLLCRSRLAHAGAPRPHAESAEVMDGERARALEKPVIVFVQNETEGSMKMLEGTHCEIVKDFASAIYRAAWAGMAL